MSVPAVRVRTSSGWRDIAIQGPPGPQGSIASAKAHGTLSFAAADQNWRSYTPALTIDYDELGGNCFTVTSGVFTAPAAGKYLVGFHLHDTPGGNCGIMPLINNSTADHGLSVTTPASASGVRGGVEHWGLYNLNAGDNLRFYGWHSGGGSPTMYIEALRLNSPDVASLSAPFLANQPGSVARLIPQQTIAFPTNDASGNSSAQIPLGFSWTTHIAFIPVYIWPLGHWGWYAKNPCAGPGSPNPQSNGQIMLNNAPAQSFNITAISIGIP